MVMRKEIYDNEINKLYDNGLHI